MLKAAVLLRREIHAHPEPGFEEHETHLRLVAALATLGGVLPAQTRRVAGTGLVVDIDSTGGVDASDVKTVALRADMDALRMTEKNEGLPHRSTNAGVAHMCGHDGHMASLVLAGALIQQRAASLPRGAKVRLLFQPAEEGPGGALPMLKEGVLEGVDEVYGYHTWPALPLGHCAVKPGALMAHVSEFTITVRGAGVHASQPHAGIDAVLVAATLIQALHTITSRSTPADAQCVVSVTMLSAGEATNVLPDTATMRGTIRDLDSKVFAIIERRIREVAFGISAAHGATADVQIDEKYPVVMNHAAQTEFVRAVADQVCRKDAQGNAHSEALLPMLGAEDFSFFLDPAVGGKPGCFFFLGGNEEHVAGLAGFDPTVVGAFAQAADGSLRRTNCMCHGTSFDYNDNCLPIAARFWVKLVEARLGCELYTAAELDGILGPL
ncbi:hypothetical protein M885DRAFT_192366 [Pelagophyceae sp. CCMP2097]|nr:hypothetical protein M885DRAFT_192366 [Pelagophyceae sp. CCMP2097]